MHNVNFEKLVRFFDDYKSHNSSYKLGLKHVVEASEIIDFSKACEILYYRSANLPCPRVFLIVPSIFNSVEILFLNSGAHFMDHLKALGDVYLMKWKEIEDLEFNLDDYAIEAAAAIVYTSKSTGQNINLIGHCIGGNIAFAAGTLKSQLVANLTLLTTPWDFSHFSLISDFHKNFNLDAEIKDLSSVPVVYTKILFFLLAPDYFNLKVDRYFDLALEQDKKLFMEVENWLMSGVSIPKSAYFQIIEQLMRGNIIAKGEWVIDNRAMVYENFHKQLFIMVAKNDQLAPKNSILPLCQHLKNVKLIELNGGHISYLVGTKLAKFFKQYSNWLEGEV